MRRKLTLLPAAVLSMPLLFGSVSIARGESPSGVEGTEAPKRIEHLKEKLKLTDDQAATIRAAFDANRDAQRELRKQMQTAMSDLRTAALDGADAATLQQKTDAATALYGKMLAMRSEQLKKIGAVLSPEQRTQFAQMREHDGHRHGHRGHHRQSGEEPPAS